MTAGTTGIVVARNLEDVQPITDVCGNIRALSTGEDFKGSSVALATMKAPTIPHYHPIATEFCFVFEGKGRLIVGKRSYEIRDGMLIIIPPENAHYTIPRTVTEVLAFSVPAWSAEDQIILHEGDIVANYGGFRERFELIDEIVLRKGPRFEEETDPWERESYETRRTAFVSQSGLSDMPIEELREQLVVPWRIPTKVSLGA